MCKFVGKLFGVAVAAAGIYALGKYLKDYTDYKAVGEDDVNSLKNSGEKAKEAVKRTYIAIRNNADVSEPAGDLGRAAAEVAEGTGKIVTSVGTNTVNFVKSEKEKFEIDPKGYKAQVGENLKDMGHQAVELFNNVKEDAQDIVSEVKSTADGFRNDPEDFVKPEEAVKPAGSEKNEKETVRDGMIVSVDTEEIK